MNFADTKEYLESLLQLKDNNKIVPFQLQTKMSIAQVFFFAENQKGMFFGYVQGFGNSVRLLTSSTTTYSSHNTTNQPLFIEYIHNDSGAELVVSAKGFIITNTNNLDDLNDLIKQPFLLQSDLKHFNDLVV